MSQVWTFRGIQPGDRVVANQGKHTVLGIGTVVGGYRFEPGTHTVEGEDYPHQIQVRWDDTTPRAVEEYGWQRTIVELTKEAFETLLAQEPAAEPKPKKTEPPPPPCDPKNIILYGPPGTGKTYSTVRRALELILGPEKLAGLGEKGLLALFREHQARGQVEFVTFHQAYGYEEFVEGIRPVLDQAAGSGVHYELHEGAFKRIALRAATEGLRMESAEPDFDELWSRLVEDLEEEDGRTAKSQSGKTYRMEVSSRRNVLVRPCEVDEEDNVTEVGEKHQTASRDNAQLIWKHKSELGPEAESFSYEKTTELFARERGSAGGHHYTALWIVYTQLLALSRAAGSRKIALVDRVARVQQALDKPGPTTTFTFSARSPQYVLIIDEINRGNMSKILGELITLLEPDKRLGARTELKLPLSYSPEHRFAVPPNLHVLGTMNTADRSIALMDVALRRRFTFEELLPDSSVIREVLRNRVPDEAFIELVVDVFETVNDRIRFLYDQDHQLGHSYFLDVRDIGDLRRLFVDRIIPMLQEYFYGAWDKICTVLGCPYDEAGAPRRTGHVVTKRSDQTVYVAPLIQARRFPEVRTLGYDHDDYEDRIDYSIDRRFQLGTLPPETLRRAFLAILEINSEDFDQRLDLLTPAPPSMDAPEPGPPGQPEETVGTTPEVPE